MLKFRNVHPFVTIYGSAKINTRHPYYKQGVELGEKLASAGMYVMTGGGPGIMEAVNKGASSVSPEYSYGCCMPFIKEESNRYLSIRHSTRYFFVRKMIFTHKARAFIAMPGGFGTLDELFEMATLIMTNKLPAIPIILYNKEFWQPFMHVIQVQLLDQGLIKKKDFESLILVDDMDEVVEIIQGRQLEVLDSSNP
tara:strand:- start:14060 stop:14647 length:588 start_codon:yes stop_codon:yes gene_type:complete